MGYTVAFFMILLWKLINYFNKHVIIKYQII